MVGGGQGAFIRAVHRIAARIDDQWELVAGVLSADPAKARASAAEIGLPRSYDNYQQMAESEAALPVAQRIDALAIVTPNHMHFPVAQCFWEHGFHVISDKPMRLNVTEAEELARLVRQKPEQLYVLTHNYSGYPMLRHARQLLRSGALGEPRFVELKYLQGWLACGARTKQAEWRGKPELAGLGGSLGDIAHPCPPPVPFHHRPVHRRTDRRVAQLRGQSHPRRQRPGPVALCGRGTRSAVVLTDCHRPGERPATGDLRRARLAAMASGTAQPSVLL